MSTTHEMFTAEELEDFAEGLKEWPGTAWETDDYELAVSPFVGFYFLYDTSRYLDTSLLMVDIHEAFERLSGHPYKVATHPDSERPHLYGSKRLPNLREFAKKRKPGDSFRFKFTDEPNHSSSPATAGYFCRVRDYMNDRAPEHGLKSYSYIQFYYRWQWWRDNRDAWRRFVLDIIDRLRPQQVYSGFAMANPLEFGTRSEVSVWERSLATRFYGLDIDDSFGMSMGIEDALPKGIRSPTWAFFLSDDWREKLSLSRDEVRNALRHPRIIIHERVTGLWIELGEQPDLYPVENGVPELPMLLNKLLRPIRNDNLDLVGTGQWDGDPNERFTKIDARRWLGRFDEDSDWPGQEERFIAPPPASAAAPPPAAPVQEEQTFPPPPLRKAPIAPAPRTPGGQACPQAGWWFTPAKADSLRYFERGEIMPKVEGSAWGDTIWQWSSDQSASRY
ncbi:type VI immunity family protein [Luteimonas salinilitoris]|uniref:Type VI immunity family protein n=1 Tax=Luteimonas salinilitoris TaxID=3237697 RepID=A0ABV4HSF9_9GAMM